MSVYDDFLSRVGGVAVRWGEPLASHTSFHIGGDADLMVFPKSSQEMQSVYLAARTCGLTPILLGAGSNILAPDERIRTVVVSTRKHLTSIRLLSDTRIEAMAGALLSKTAVFACAHSLSGLEFTHGIPGTVGGGVFMNAGAYGGTISELVESVTHLTPEGTVETLSHDALEFSYRKSIFCKTGTWILSAVFRLTPGDRAEIDARMRELAGKRRASQPLELPSAGSAFKRPPGQFAGALIEAAGLKGVSVGGAMVSEKHAGFLVNTGGATAADVRALIAEVQARVFADSGVLLEPEIRIL